MNKAIYRAVFFVGWLLSPLTFWNDILVNIPLAYLLASFTVFVYPFNFLITTVVWYWLTNIIGLAMMAVGGQRIFTDRSRVIREAIILIGTMAIYSAILVLLNVFGILKPVHAFLSR